MQTKRNYTIDQILNYDVEELHTMTEDELLDLVRGSVNKVRRRARSIEVHNVETVSVPYDTLMESGGYSFDKSKYRRNQDGSIKRNDLIADVLRYQNFLGSQTSNYKGLMEWDEHVTESFGKSLEDRANLAEQQAKDLLNPFDNSITPEAQALFDKAAMLRAQAEEQRRMYAIQSWEQKAEYWKLVDEIKATASETVSFWDSGRLHTLIIEEISSDDYSDLPFGERVDKLKAILEDKKKVEIQREFSGR